MKKSPCLFLKAFLTYSSFIALCTSEEAPEVLLRLTFESEEFVPEIFLEPPQELLKVVYNDLNVPLGGSIAFYQAANPPTLIWDDKDAYYTIIMTDPDSPSRADPKLKELEHWIVGNIYRRNISSGQAFAEYVGPKDAREYDDEKGIHRYIISVFEQSGEQFFTDRSIPRDNMLFRGLFNTSHFVKEHKLRGPVAATYFTVDHEATELIPKQKSAKHLWQFK